MQRLHVFRLGTAAALRAPNALFSPVICDSLYNIILSATWLTFSVSHWQVTLSIQSITAFLVDRIFYHCHSRLGFCALPVSQLWAGLDGLRVDVARRGPNVLDRPYLRFNDVQIILLLPVDLLAESHPKICLSLH